MAGRCEGLHQPSMGLVASMSIRNDHQETFGVKALETQMNTD
jgi:hypothetical protein